MSEGARHGNWLSNQRRIWFDRCSSCSTNRALVNNSWSLLDTARLHCWVCGIPVVRRVDEEVASLPTPRLSTGKFLHAIS